uniref:Uncharacterized protein n=1 Tax=Acrobeloides nanus TaxID=290746 RepID=A0A914CFQ3_9BILA
MYMSPTLFGLNLTFVTPLAKALGPSYFRVGGTHADYAIFQEKNSTVDKGQYVFSFKLLDETYSFVQNAGWRLIFDLNDMLRTNETSTGRWNSSNAQLFLNYTSQKGYELDFELGNGFWVW